MIDWDQWQTMLAVFRNGTYAGAAQSLGVDATTVGRRLKLLEKHLGYDLFLRQDGRLFPTNRCETLLAHIESADEALRGAEKELATAQLGAVWRTLRLTAPPFLVTHLFAPAIRTLTDPRRMRIELMGTASRAGLSRREADIAIRIHDRPEVFRVETGRIEAEEIGALAYATYCSPDRDPETLPWAGLMEQYVRTSGTRTMLELAGTDGFHYQAYHFEPLREIAAAGVARVMLPRLMGDPDRRLVAASDTVLEQPLWMLYHRQDRDVHHLRAAREWIVAQAGERLSARP